MNNNPWFDHPTTEPTPPQGSDTPLFDALAAAIPRSPVPSPSPAEPLSPSSAVLDIFTRVKRIEAADGSWNDGDVVAALSEWFAEFGIDVEDDAIAAAQVLSVPAWPARDLTAATSEHGSLVLHVRTGLPHPLTQARSYLAALVDGLGPDSSVSVFDARGDQIAHLLHPGIDPKPH